MKKTRGNVFAGVLATGAVVAAIAAPSSTAADNTKLSGAFSYTDPTLCADPVTLAESYDETMHTYYDASGTAIRLSFTGKVRITYTDVRTGATYSPNSSGPATVDLQTGQTVIRGGNGALFNAQGVLVATDGRVVLDANGNVISPVHHQTSVCTQLGTTS